MFLLLFWCGGIRSRRPQGEPQRFDSAFSMPRIRLTCNYLNVNKVLDFSARIILAKVQKNGKYMSRDHTMSCPDICSNRQAVIGSREEHDKIARDTHRA